MTRRYYIFDDDFTEADAQAMAHVEGHEPSHPALLRWDARNDFVGALLFGMVNRETMMKSPVNMVRFNCAGNYIYPSVKR